MEKSYEEILRLLERLDISPEGLVFRGATDVLRDGAPQESAAVDDLIAKAQTADPLYVVAIGALTNVASAMLQDPAIIERIVVVWLGGHAHYWPTANEFNLQGDLVAAQLVFDSGVPFVQIPCHPVASPLDDAGGAGALRQGARGEGRLSGRDLHRLFPKPLRRFQGDLGHVGSRLAARCIVGANRLGA